MERVLLRGPTRRPRPRRPEPAVPGRSLARRAPIPTRRWGTTSLSRRRSAAPGARGHQDFGGIAAVDDVSIEVGRGESMGLVGPTAPARPRLFNCVCGQLRPERGTRRVRRRGPARHAHLRAGPAGRRPDVPAGRGLPGHDRRRHLLVALRARWRKGRLWRDLCNRQRRTARGVGQGRRPSSTWWASATGPTCPVASLGLGSCRSGGAGPGAGGRPGAAAWPTSRRRASISMRPAELGTVLRQVQRDRGMSMVLVEHDLTMVAEVVDRTVVMNLGEVVAEGDLRHGDGRPDGPHSPTWGSTA